ncbi:MAG: uroporphyrinogen-III synthase [Burkholderiales bacterium]|nr:uroporphyrinogen-III synthase [Burkholderiales bacterium]
MKPLTLISTRPTIVRADQSIQHESVLEPIFCEQHGITEIQMPAFELSTRAPALETIQRWLMTAKSAVRGSCMVVFVSPGALELLRSSFPDPWPDGLRVGLMGDGSASKAIKLGIPQGLLTYPSQSKGENQDSAALLDCIKKNSATETIQRLLLLKGPRGRDDFAQQVQALGIELQTCHAYHRKAFHYTTQDIKSRTGTVATPSKLCFYLTSSESVDVFKSVMADMSSARSDSQCLTLVTHPRIAQAAIAAQHRQVVLIEPGQKALQERLLQQIQT